MKAREVGAGSLSELHLVLNAMQEAGMRIVRWTPTRWSNTRFLVYYEDETNETVETPRDAEGTR